MIRWPSDPEPLARKFRAAKPFAHLVLDGVLAPADHARVAAAFEQEPQVLLEKELHLHLRSSDPPLAPALRELHEAIRASCAQVALLSGRRLSRADGAAYAYLPGHYLLPHSDSSAREGRAVAYAYYAGAPARGGELELYSCRARKGVIVATRPARRIAARPNRLVLFEVHDLALHQVREVLAGTRTSLAGWFYP